MNKASHTSRLASFLTVLALCLPLWAALTGQVLVAMAAYGVDHDLAQRFLVATTPVTSAAMTLAELPRLVSSATRKTASIPLNP